MGRRIILAFVAVLAVSLFIAGTLSLFLVQRAAGDQDRSQLLKQAQALAKNTHSKAIDAITQNAKTNVYSTLLLPFLQAVTDDKVEPALEISSRNGKVVSMTPLSGVPSSAIAANTLIGGKAVSGLVGSVAFAIAPLFSVHDVPGTPSGTIQTLAIALENPVSSSDDNAWYFLLAGGVSLVVAAGLAAVISRRIAGHVVTAAQAAQQIAGGDLATRIEPTGREYPELAQLGSSLNTMAANLERSRNLERQFLLSISHDLRTPLTSIRGYSEAIAEGVTADIEQAAKVLVVESDRLGRLIGDLLDLARIDAREFSLNHEPIDVVAVAEAAAEALRYEFDASDVSISFHSQSESLTIVGDADRLGQVASNLIENALKFARSSVIVSVSHDGDVSLSVEDDGPGIATEDLSRVFDRHFTSGRGKARTTGTGLGLAIVAELVEAMNGRIEVTSPLSDGAGTRMSVHFRESASPTSGTTRQR